MELLSVAMKDSEQRRHWTNDALDRIQLVIALLTNFRHLSPMGQGSQMVFLVVTVIEGQEVVKTAVITHGVSVKVFGQGAVVFVIVLYVDKHEGEEEGGQVT